MSKKNAKLEAGLKNLFSKPAPVPEPEPEPEVVAAAPPEPSPAQPEPAASAPPAPVAASAPEMDVASEDETQLVIFKLDSEYYGLEVRVIDSIIKMQETTIIPHAFDYVEGVTNLRGTVLPVVDLRTRFGLERAELTKETRVVVVTTGGDTVGLVVDAVTEVLRIPQSRIEPPSFFVASLDSAYITGIAKMEDRLITLLDLDKIFARQDTLEKAAI